MRRLINKIVLSVLVLAVAVLLYPMPQTTAPEWKVTVVDDKGAHLAGIGVRETWRQSSLEDKDHEDLATTDANGSVSFPKRVIVSSYLRRAYGCYQQHRIGAVCGPHASVWAFGTGLGTLHDEDTQDASAKFENFESFPERMVESQSSMILLHHCPMGHFGAGCNLSEDYKPTNSHQ